MLGSQEEALLPLTFPRSLKTNPCGLEEPLSKLNSSSSFEWVHSNVILYGQET